MTEAAFIADAGLLYITDPAWLADAAGATDAADAPGLLPSRLCTAEHSHPLDHLAVGEACAAIEAAVGRDDQQGHLLAAAVTSGQIRHLDADQCRLLGRWLHRHAPRRPSQDAGGGTKAVDPVRAAAQQLLDLADVLDAQILLEGP